MYNAHTKEILIEHSLPCSFYSFILSLNLSFGLVLSSDQHFLSLLPGSLVQTILELLKSSVFNIFFRNGGRKLFVMLRKLSRLLGKLRLLQYAWLLTFMNLRHGLWLLKLLRLFYR
nr:unnamed protein product [Callosobruchus chinensis]